MALLLQGPEVQFAQKLASNQKPIRTRAIKKLKKYIGIRSQKQKGGFTSEELLKIWKGLFYCMWMQDKPLLQEELSAVLSNLIHVFQSMDSKFLFVETFLQTMNREWTGIDRLRMDKFYMLVRMVFRQTFEMLKKRCWDQSLVQRFTELLTVRVLQSNSGCPCGVQFHILDIYMTELAAVGAQELTAEQNLIFIDPFCKVAAKTKDHLLLQAICNNIFSEVLNQAPFAIEDLMKELQQLENNSEDELDLEDKDLMKNSKDSQEDQINGLENGYEPSEGDGDGIGPVLQFDYKAIAGRLFDLTSRRNTPPLNRKKLYRLVKKFQDLSEGVFPQDGYTEEVSTDEDDDLFGNRKRLKKKKRRNVEEDPASGEKGQGTQAPPQQEHDPRMGYFQTSEREWVSSNASLTLIYVYNLFFQISLEKGMKPEHCNHTNALSYCCGGEGSEKSKSTKKRPLKASDPKSVEPTAVPAKKKKKEKTRKKTQRLPDLQECPSTEDKEPETTAIIHPAEKTLKLKKKRKLEEPSVEAESSCSIGQVEAGEILMKKKQKKVPSQERVVGEGEGKEQCVLKKQTSLKIKKWRKKQQVNTVALLPENPPANDVSGATLKLKKMKKPLKTGKLEEEVEFLKFGRRSVPSPLFFKKRKGGSSFLSSKGFKTPQDSKKVTFGLKNNKTAEFKKTDKSLLVSPAGTSRVVFDPQQKPLFGVLKTPDDKPGPRRKLAKNPLQGKSRPKASDFF
uniref:Ribosomal RNA processing 1B n=1 Tax=Lepisosteus oculatus TaxID=7918 RepID=W5M905_LEPOC